MIPKTVHYIWLSSDPKPALIKTCLDSWKKLLRGYEFKEWSMEDFDFDKVPQFVNEAVEKKKYAFACDYLRMWVLYNYGGIYMDSDVFLKKNIDNLLENRFFTCIEYHEDGFLPYKNRIDNEGHALTDLHIPGFCLQAAFLGSEKGHPFVKSCLDWYTDRHFIKEDGTPDMDILAPDVYAICARKFGFLYKNTEQSCQDGIKIYPSTLVAGSPGEYCKGNTAIHCCAGSWRNGPSKIKKMYASARKRLWLFATKRD